jgi:hypothetical protein
LEQIKVENNYTLYLCQSSEQLEPINKNNIYHFCFDALKIFNRKFEYYITKFEEKAKIILKRVVYEIFLSRTHLGFIPSDKIMT